MQTMTSKKSLTLSDSAKSLLSKKVFLMAGLTGSGKSSLAQQIQRTLGAECLSSDLIREQLTKQTQFDSIGQKQVDQARHQVYALMYEQATKLAKSNQRVIIDATHIEPDKYQKALAELKKVIPPSDICFIAVKTHPKTIEARMKKFAHLPNKSPQGKITETKFEAWRRVHQHMMSLRSKGLAGWPSSRQTQIEVLSSTSVKRSLASIKKAKKLLSNITYFVFDLDGTLYPPSQGLNQLIENKKLEQVAKKLNVSPEQAAKKFLARYQKFGSNTKALNSFGIDGQVFFISIWNQINLTQHIDKDPDLRTAFSTVIAKPKSSSPNFAILTNANTLETAKKKLKAIGLDYRWFGPILTSVEIGHHKPDQRAFWPVLKLANSPTRLLYIGDREETDIAPARALGMKTVLINWNNKKPTDSQADLVLKKPHHLLKLLTICQ